MIYKQVVLIVFVMFIGFGCAAKKEIPPYTPTPPTLAQQLDNLYLNNHDLWASNMKKYIGMGRTDLPANHLIHALEELNSTKTKKLCLEAAYLYLNNIANKQGYFTGYDEELFVEFVEVALKSTESRAITHIDQLCRIVNNEVCKRIK